MQLALTLGVSQTNYAAAGAKPPSSNNVVSVIAQGQLGTITVSIVNGGGGGSSGSPLGLLLTVTNP